MTEAKHTPLKRNEVLSFDDGLLTVKMSGHGSADGWATLSFHERQIEIDADGFHTAEISPSELRELRDFLNRVVPDNSQKSVLAATREHVQRLEVQRDELLKALKAGRKYVETCSDPFLDDDQTLKQVDAAIAMAGAA